MPLVASSAHPGGAPFFTYQEFPGWDVANKDQLDALDLLVAQLLEPARVALGVPIVVTRNGWITGDHAVTSVHPLGAAVDLAAGSPPSLEETWALFVWLAQNARFGELEWGQPSSGATGHVHVTLPGYGGSQQVLYQRPDGGLVALDPFLVGRIRAA